MAWVLGQRLQGGKYTLEKELGIGGFGITYLARDKNGLHVVIKTLSDKLQHRSDFAKFQQDFLNEALRLAKCSHPHIVQINEVIQEREIWGIVMEYIDGENLASRVENRDALPEEKALKYIQQLGKALTVVHNHGLLHRDIKPANIVLRSGKSEVVLIDFGIAREFIPNLTQTHTQFLSDGFAPIEQYDKRGKRGAYTDVYALAATLYALLTGEVPTLSPLRATGISLEEPKSINPCISDRVNQAILKGMEIEAENRPQSVQAWLELFSIGDRYKSFSPLQENSVISGRAIKRSIPSLSKTPLVNLISAEGADYRKLQKLLATQKWWKAEEETNAIMRWVARCEKDGWFTLEDIKHFPCEDLCMIDQLWVKYSKGVFGFSRQRRIWQEVGQDSIKFGERIRWRVRANWIPPDELIFKHPAPIGHLPGWGLEGLWWEWNPEQVIWNAFFSRVEDCGL